MFYCLCKSIALHHGRRRRSNAIITSSITCKLYHFLQDPLSSVAIATAAAVRFISSGSETPIQHSFAASYLITKCGFSPQSALLASKRLKFKTPDKPDSVIAIFKRCGFTQQQIFKVIEKCPRVLSCKPEKTLIPKLAFLHSKGMSPADMACILGLLPIILFRSLEKILIPNFNFLSELLQSNDKAIVAVKRSPRLLYINHESFVQPFVNILQDNGVPRSQIATLIYNWPRSLQESLDHFRKTTETIKEMGFLPSMGKFTIALMVMIILRKSGWKRRFGIYKGWGWSEREILAAFRKQPFCMLASEDKIMAVMDFLVNKMDCKSSFIAKNPYLIGLSLEKRIMPRASVIRFLLSHKLIDEEPNLLSSFMCYEELFLKRFVNCFDEAPQLLKLYRDALNKSVKTTCNS